MLASRFHHPATSSHLTTRLPSHSMGAVPFRRLSSNAAVAKGTKPPSAGSKSEVEPLFQPLTLRSGDQLDTRMVYPPLTRCRAIDNIPQSCMVEYYSQRAHKNSLVIAEATVVSGDGYGYPHTPGIYTQQQVEAWKPITKALQDKGTIFFSQLWHCGRASHPVFQEGGKAPVSSSAVAISSEKWKNCYLGDGKMGEYPVPAALDTTGIKEKVAAYRQGARNAIAAGFKGVEIHAANGYLIDQFTKDGVNKRTDEYGGCIENRCRFALEVAAAVCEEIGAERVGIRLSPVTTFLDAIDSTPYATFTYLVEQLNKLNMAYLHMVEPRIDGNDTVEDVQFSLDPFREIWKGPFIRAGGFTRESGAEAVAKGDADLIAYGRLWLANPDLPERFQKGALLNKYDRNTFYSHDPKVGYTDYPFLEEAK